MPFGRCYLEMVFFKNKMKHKTILREQVKVVFTGI